MKRHTVPSPVPAGHAAKVPVIIQMEALECGAASLAMVLAYYGRYIPLSQVRKDCGVSRDGSNMKSMYLVAQSYGLKPSAFRYNAEDLQKKASYPCILFWDRMHFVVLRGCRGNKFLLNDPGQGDVILSKEEFSQHYSGVCMCFAPTDSFVQEGKPESILSFALSSMKGTLPMFLLITLTSLILTLTGLIEPAFPRLFVDVLLTDSFTATSRAIVFFAALAVISFIRSLATRIRINSFNTMQARMTIISGTRFLWHILHLPMDFFSQRMPGDIMNRSQSHTTVMTTMVSRLAPLLLDIATMIFYLLLMLSYNPVLAGIGVVSVGVNFMISRMAARKQVNISRVSTKNTASLINTGISGLNMMETVKSAGAEEGFFSNWSGIHAACTLDQANQLELSAFWGQLPSLLSALTSSLILCMSVGLVIRGEWTMGLVSAFSGYLTAFSNPAGQLVNTLQGLQETRTDVERINDVMNYPSDLSEENETIAEDIDYTKCTGRVEMKNITFGYQKIQAPLIRNFTMTLLPGSSVAFVGSSGCGKSTLARLLTGLNQPWDGEVLYDGKPIRDIPRSIFTASVASVDQEIAMFEDTIRNNITMWDRSISDEAVLHAIRDAAIEEDVMNRENALDAVLTTGGQNLSGGQRQRIEIARSLATEPTILIMDEATSALDAETEFRVMEAIRKRHITTVIISHRLSTVRDCDEIIVMRNGEVIDRGRHEELMNRCEYYASLITGE